MQKVALGFPGIQRRVLGFPAGAAAAAGVPGAAAAAPPLSPSPIPSHSAGGVRAPAAAALAEAGQKQQLVQGLEARMQAFLAQRDIARLLEGVTAPHFSRFCGLHHCGEAGVGRQAADITWSSRRTQSRDACSVAAASGCCLPACTLAAH